MNDASGIVDLAELQSQAVEVGRIYAERFSIDRDGAFYLGKLSEELGEVCAAYLKLKGQSRGADQDPDHLQGQLEDEMADLFGFLLMFADRQGVDLGAAFARKWGKYLKDPA